MNFDLFVINSSKTVKDALSKIDKNKKGFLIVNDIDGKVCGTLTDGDIRRAFLNSKTLDDNIETIVTIKYKYLRSDCNLTDAIDLFKNESIKFIPVIACDGTLENILTKDQMHSLLLQDIRADLTYDFQTLDDNIVNHEIYQRPWGFYKTTVMNEYFQSKIICVNPKSQLSLQSHDHREEHWIVAHGNGTVQLDQSVLEVHCGSSIFIPKGAKHRLTNTDEHESLIITEVQIGNYFGEDDIHRYEDIYGRT